jgi:foldase protein PrsA
MDFPLRKPASLLAVCALAIGFAACGGDGEKSPGDVPPDAIALIGDTKVPKVEFDALLERAKTTYKAQKREFPKVGSPEYQDLKTRAVAFLVQRYEFRAEAEEMDIEITEEDVDKKLDELKKELFQGDEKKFQDALEKEGLTEEQARGEVRDRLVQEKIYEAVTKDAEVTDAEIGDYYEKNKAQFTQPASRDVRHILVKTSAKADELYNDLQNGASFPELAREFSQDTSTKAKGGKLPITKGSTEPPFEKAAFGLGKNEISKPVKTQFGWHVIQAVSPVKPEKVTPLDAVRDSIKQQLEQQKKNEAMQQWVRDLEKKYKDEIVYAAGFEPPKTDTGTGTTETESDGPATTG